MAKRHGKDTVFIFNGVDISGHQNTTEWEETADEHDVTTYGNDSHVFAGGLHGGSATIGGIYDSSLTTGPRYVIKPQKGNNVPVLYRPEGTGTGLPEDSAEVLVKSYKESAPVADMIMWTATLTLSGDVTSAPQA